MPTDRRGFLKLLGVAAPAAAVVAVTPAEAEPAARVRALEGCKPAIVEMQVHVDTGVHVRPRLGMMGDADRVEQGMRGVSATVVVEGLTPPGWGELVPIAIDKPGAKPERCGAVVSVANELRAAELPRTVLEVRFLSRGEGKPLLPDNWRIDMQPGYMTSIAFETLFASETGA